MHTFGAWCLMLLTLWFCQNVVISLTSSNNGAVDNRRSRRSNCKPGRKARSYLDTARLWERDLTELRVYMDDKFYEFSQQFEFLRSQLADVGNEVSRISWQECDSISGQSPLHLRLERLENSLAGLLLRLEERLTHPTTDKSNNVTMDTKEPTSMPAPMPTPQAKEMGSTMEKESAINVKLQHRKQIPPDSPNGLAMYAETKKYYDQNKNSKDGPTLPMNAERSRQPTDGIRPSCFWYEPQPSHGAPFVIRRQTNNQEEETYGLKSCEPKAELLKDCSDGPLPRTPGVYWIQPKELRKPAKVFCDAEGWMVIQRRGMSPLSSPENFNRSWLSYSRGFGDLCKDFWIGNYLLHQLTTAYNTSLRIQFSDFKGTTTSTAFYGKFHVGKENKGFPLTVEDFHGDAKDGLGFQSEMPFATKDRASSPLALACANLEGSGWWVSETAYSHFVQCNHHILGSNLNAPYAPFTTLQDEFVKLCPLHNGTKVYQHVKYAKSVYWRGKYITPSTGLNTIEMKIRPKV